MSTKWKVNIFQNYILCLQYFLLYKWAFIHGNIYQPFNFGVVVGGPRQKNKQTNKTTTKRSYTIYLSCDTQVWLNYLNSEKMVCENW